VINHSILTPAQKYEIGKRAAEIETTIAIRYFHARYPEEPEKLVVNRFRLCKFLL